MRTRILRRRTGGSLAISIAIHIALIFALASIAWRYPLGQMMGIPKPDTKPERLLFIALPTRPTESSGGGVSVGRSSAPAALRAPVSVPNAVAVPAPADTSRAQAAGGTGTGFGIAGTGVATGVAPRQPDSRIALMPGSVARVPRTPAEAVDSIVELAIGIYNDSMALYARNNKTGEWIRKGKNGDIWGMDQSNIYLGKVKIPTALLALLPLNANSRVGPIEARSLAYIRRDVLENAQRSISEDEFRSAVRRIRERKEREKRQKQLAADGKGSPPTP